MKIVPTNDNIHIHYTALHMGSMNGTRPDAVNAKVVGVGPDVEGYKVGDEVLIGFRVGSLIVSLTALDWMVEEDDILAIVLP